jgi:hypothetical protein
VAWDDWSGRSGAFARCGVAMRVMAMKTRVDVAQHRPHNRPWWNTEACHERRDAGSYTAISLACLTLS